MDTNDPPPPGDPPLPDRPRATAMRADSEHILYGFACQLSDRILDELAKIEITLAEQGDTVEGRVKLLLDHFKLVQNVADIMDRLKKKHDETANRGRDIVEFRRELEAQIARLVDEEASGTVPGAAG